MAFMCTSQSKIAYLTIEKYKWKIKARRAAERKKEREREKRVRKREKEREREIQNGANISTLHTRNAMMDLSHKTDFAPTISYFTDLNAM